MDCCDRGSLFRRAHWGSGLLSAVHKKSEKMVFWGFTPPEPELTTLLPIVFAVCTACNDAKFSGVVETGPGTVWHLGVDDLSVKKGGVPA